MQIRDNASAVPTQERRTRRFVGLLDRRRGSPTRNFGRHYVEMLVAMVLGMMVLGPVFALLLGVAGVDVAAWDTDAPELVLLGMAFTMSVPMVAWMRYRGHAWARGSEMTASMFLPSFAAIALLWAGLVEDTDALLAIQHLAMLPSMLVAMLLRRDEYTGHAGHSRTPSGVRR